MATKAKWYVVWRGLKPGVYTSWADVQAQIEGFKGAAYKSFLSEKDAMEAFRAGPAFLNPASRSNAGKAQKPSGPFVVVDASSLGVPGPTEYQGFLMPDKQNLFSNHIGLATNNIGEFLGIVHALALLKNQNSPLPIYSDSMTALSWVRNRKVKSELKRDAKTENAWRLVDRALIWLAENPKHNPVYKWETEAWGENPADYGRK
jgi:ribonuclease HI